MVILGGVLFCIAQMSLVMAFVINKRKRKQAEEQSQAREQLFSLSMDSLRDRIVIFEAIRDDNGKIIDFTVKHVNEAVCRAHRKRKEDMIGKRMLDVWPGLAGQEFDDYCRVCEQGEPLLSETFTYKDANGHIDGVYDRQVVKVNDGIAVRVHDITDRVRLEEEIAHFDRLSLVGEMAASIGHEVRNPMTTIRGYLQIFHQKEEFTRYRGSLETMIEELDRANAIITDFLSLAKNKQIEMKPDNLNNVLTALYPLLQADAFQRGHSLQVKTSAIEDMYLDESEMRQLILNLVRNSYEAMEAGGYVTIMTYSEGNTVVLAVEDSGSGIPKHIQEKIGTPFQTTKDSGTGLGLSVCYRIAQRHNAKIDFRTGPAGTTFFIRFQAN